MKEFYSTRQSQFTQQSERHQAKYNLYAFVRLGVFLAGLGTALWLGTYHLGAGIAFFVVLLLFFYRFILWHQAIKRQELHTKNLARINENELLALDHKFEQFSAGSEFINPLHPYSLDLDLFGPHSIFQYCNRTVTILGKRKLADYLSQRTNPPEIRSRQESIAELRDMADWRQHFQAYGIDTNDAPEHVRALQIWLSKNPFVFGNSLYTAALYIIPLWTLLFLGLISPYNPWYISLVCLLPAAYLLNRTLKSANETHNQTSKAGEMLANYAFLIRHIENHQFQADQLKNLQAVFFNEGKSASRALQQLAYTISQLNVRYNAFTIFLNLGGLWDLQWIYRLEAWKLRSGDQLLKWFESMQEFEALISLATAFYNNPDWTFPSIAPEGQNLKAIEIAHPLIQKEKRVANDFSSPLRAHIKLVTGSNMAGKSTFLRTVGLNVVLAMAGAPVCAKELELPLIQIYTSMRTQDALHESTSSFFAELKRLKFIIDEVEKGLESDYTPYFLLDEILKGTNSKDRHTGGEALIRQMIKAGGAGIIATHDLELGKLEEEFSGRIENLCMEVEIDGDELDFDYKLKKGVSQSFNATMLMKNMGIDILE